jgi:formylglycine-generating enzyme required for sulfatase activity
MHLILILLSSLLFGVNFNNGDPLPIKDKSKTKQFNKYYAKVSSGSLDLNGKTFTLDSDFYMFKTEVTNLDYREFIADIKLNRKYVELKNIIEIKKGDGELISGDTYFKHPAYEDYPVVNITKDAANLYCEWLKEKLVENLEVSPSEIDVRLPSKIEWIYAAKATKSENVYGWNGLYLRNAEGNILANFNSSLSSEDITFDQSTNSYKVVVDSQYTPNSMWSPAKSYLPNDLGLFNMSGNVAEFVQDDSNVAMGGSYMSTGYDVRAESETVVKASNGLTGFRPIVIFK